MNAPKQMAALTSLLLAFVLLFRTTVAFTSYSSSQPHRHHNMVTAMNPTLITRSHHGSASYLTRLSMVGRLFRRRDKKRKGGVKTLEREDKKSQKTKKQEKDPMWRVMLHNTEYQPDIVARILAQVIPSLDRRAGFELVTHARFAGKVTLVITSKKQAEFYCLVLSKQGLLVTIEPHDVER